MLRVLHCDFCGKTGMLPVALELEAEKEENWIAGGGPDGEPQRRMHATYRYVKRLLFHSLECLDGWRARVGETGSV